MKSKKKIPDGMYTAKEAISILGLSSTTFYSMVTSGAIKRVVPPGRKEGFYPRTNIDQFSRNLKAFSEPYAQEKLEFGLALKEDLEGIHEMVANVAGGYAHAVPTEVLKAWIRKNPQSAHVLRRGSEVVGYIAMFPLPKDTLHQRLEGHLLNRAIPVDDIGQYLPDTKILLYIAEMAVKHRPDFIKNNEPDPDRADSEARRLGLRLIREAGRFVANLRKERVTIEGLYAVGTTPFGMQMCRDLGMQAMDDLPSGVREDRMPFKLDIQEGVGSVLVRKVTK